MRLPIENSAHRCSLGKKQKKNSPEQSRRTGFWRQDPCVEPTEWSDWESDERLRPVSNSLSSSTGLIQIHSESRFLCSCDENYFKKFDNHKTDQKAYVWSLKNAEKIPKKTRRDGRPRLEWSLWILRWSQVGHYWSRWGNSVFSPTICFPKHRSLICVSSK